MVQIVKMIMTLAEPAAGRIAVRSAREFRSRDLGDGNYILIGSPTSNPWVSLFEHFLNFQEVDEMENGHKFFLNRDPQPDELQRYEGIQKSGTTGLAYATIALVPNEQHVGSILILQGLQPEGSEAAVGFLACDKCIASFLSSLRSLNQDPERAGFEILIAAKSIAGTPGEIRTVALRTIK
jgi:hypothetical protein